MSLDREHPDDRELVRILRDARSVADAIARGLEAQRERRRELFAKRVEQRAVQPSEYRTSGDGSTCSCGAVVVSVASEWAYYCSAFLAGHAAGDDCKKVYPFAQFSLEG